MAGIQKVLIHEENVFYVRSLESDFHTQYGYVSKNDLKKKGVVKSNTGAEFFVFDACFVDKFAKLKRGAQIITLKDAATIVTETGVNQESHVLDAGGGSGALACVLGNICKSVVTYEIREDFAKVITENAENFGFTNITVRNKDVTKGISEKNLDLVVFDLPDSSKALKHAVKALKIGGFLVLYVPSMTQVIKAVKDLRKNKNLFLVKVIENIQREWKVEDKICRPEFQMLGHTGFLVIGRKLV